MTATSTPPITGPTMMPALRPIPSKLFAQAMSSSRSARAGIAAAEADQNGDSAMAEANASGTSSAGRVTNAIAAKNTAATTSAQIITCRRSNRSPRCPVTGPRMPTTPNVSSRVPDCQSAECVECQTENISAVYAAAPPVTEMRRPMARRRTLLRGVGLMKRLLVR